MSNTSANFSGDFYLPIDTLTPPRNPIGTTSKSVMPPLHNAFLTALLDECDGVNDDSSFHEQNTTLPPGNWPGEGIPEPPSLSLDPPSMSPFDFGQSGLTISFFGSEPPYTTDFGLTTPAFPDVSLPSNDFLVALSNMPEVATEDYNYGGTPNDFDQMDMSTSFPEPQGLYTTNSGWITPTLPDVGLPTNDLPASTFDSPGSEVATEDHTDGDAKGKQRLYEEETLGPPAIPPEYSQYYPPFASSIASSSTSHVRAEQRLYEEETLGPPTMPAEYSQYYPPFGSSVAPSSTSHAGAKGKQRLYEEETPGPPAMPAEYSQYYPPFGSSVASSPTSHVGAKGKQRLYEEETPGPPAMPAEYSQYYPPFGSSVASSSTSHVYEEETLGSPTMPAEYSQDYPSFSSSVASSSTSHVEHGEPSSSTAMWIDNRVPSVPESPSSPERTPTPEPEPKGKPPRPQNKFMLFKNYYGSKVHKRGDISDANLSLQKKIAKTWKELPPDEKQEWVMMAEKEKIEHALKYPGYTYEPNRKKMGSEKTKPKKTKPKKTNPKKRKSKKKGPEK